MKSRVKGAAALRRWFGSAEALLDVHVEQLNQLNVFPVADSDTGTNMLAAARACREAADAAESEDLGELLAAAGESAMDHAYGNSGTLTAVLISGFAEPLSGYRRLTLPGFAAALQRASLRAWSALSDPVEGTMLSVLDAVRDQALRACAEADEPESRAALEKAMPELMEAARTALFRTQTQLEPLNAARVVDAGGAGLLLILSALEATVLGLERPRDLLEGAAGLGRGQSPRSATLHTAGDEIMATVLMDPLQAAGLRYRINELATEVILTPIGQADPLADQLMRWRIHAHAAEPQEVLCAISEAGTVESSEVNPLGDHHGPEGS